MAMRSYPFAGEFTGVDDNGFPTSDRDYNEEDFARILTDLKQHGVTNRDNNPMLVTAAGGRDIRINYGTMFIHGRYGEVYDEPEYLTLEPGDGQPRIDLISMRMDTIIARAITPIIIRGVPSVSPVMPELIRDSFVHDMILAKIYVPAGANSITQDNITDTRGDKDLCGMRDWSMDDRGQPNGVAPLVDGVVPDEAKYQVGDILFTRRNDLSDNWRLCNGDIILPGEYPLLEQVYSNSGSLMSIGTSWKRISLGSGMQFVTFANNFWVAVGANGKMWYKEGSPFGAWTEVTIGTVALNCVHFANGYWVAVGATGQCYYKSGNSPVGTWSSFTAGTKDLHYCTYKNGYWVLSGVGNAIYYKTTNPVGTWSTANVYGAASNSLIRSVDFDGSYWSAGYVNSSAYVAYGMSNAPLFSTSVVAHGLSTQEAYWSVIYDDVNKIWIGAGYSIFYRATNPAGTFTRILDSNISGQAYSRVAKCGNAFIGVGMGGLLAYNKGSTSQAWTLNGQGTENLLAVAYGNNWNVAIGANFAYVVREGMYKLPEIALDTYAYIRVKKEAA